MRLVAFRKRLVAYYSLRGEGGKNEPIVHEGYLQII